MLGYLRPHIQTIFPGTKAIDYDGEPGWYWVEFTFQPSPILFIEVAEASLRSEFLGDSLLILTDPLNGGTDRKHVFTIKARRHGLEYFVYCNAKGRLSHINAHYQASGLKNALEYVSEGIRPFVSGWSLRFNVPIYVFRIRVLEEKSNVVRNIIYHQLYSPVRVSQKDFNRVYRLPEDDRIISFYHDALNATCPKYQFLCYYKAIELAYGLRNKKTSESKEKGEEFIRPREIFPDIDTVKCHLNQDIQAQLLGKKFTSIRDDILRPLRNKIAHGIFEESCDEIASDEEVYPYLPVAKYIAEQLIISEIGLHVLSTNESIQGNSKTRR